MFCTLNLVSCSTPARCTVSLGWRVLGAGLAADEVALLVAAAAEASGEDFQVVTVPSPYRAALFEGFDAVNDADLLSQVSEECDSRFERPLLVAGCGALPDDPKRAQAVVEDTVEAHILEWELREPMGTAATTWLPEEARIASYHALDGAIVDDPDGTGRRWDVSEVAVIDGGETGGVRTLGPPRARTTKMLIR